MKPRRWYSSPEANPNQKPGGSHPFPEPVYWVFTACTRLEQGPILKSAPAGAQGAAAQREARPVRTRLPRITDAA
jgi:hypothetical protein